MILPRNLVQAVRNHHVIPFVGAGVSQGVKRGLFPSWKELLEGLAQELEEEGLSDHRDQVLASLASNQYLDAAEEALRGLGPFLFNKSLRKRFRVKKPPDANLATVRALWELRPSLVLTTNYDDVLIWGCEHAERLANDQADELRLLHAEETPEQPRIWHLHGTIHRLSTIILGGSHYQRLYRAPTPALTSAPLPVPDPALAPARALPKEEQARQQEAFRDYAWAVGELQRRLEVRPFLYVGFSLSDDYVMEQVKYVLQVTHAKNAPSYALMRKGQGNKAFLKTQYNIQLIEYEDYQDLPKLLEALREQAFGPRVVPPPASVPSPAPPPAPQFLSSTDLPPRSSAPQMPGGGAAMMGPISFSQPPSTAPAHRVSAGASRSKDDESGRGEEVVGASDWILDEEVVGASDWILGEEVVGASARILFLGEPGDEDAAAAPLGDAHPPSSLEPGDEDGDGVLAGSSPLEEEALPPQKIRRGPDDAKPGFVARASLLDGYQHILQRERKLVLLAPRRGGTGTLARQMTERYGTRFSWLAPPNHPDATEADYCRSLSGRDDVRDFEALLAELRRRGAEGGAEHLVVLRYEWGPVDLLTTLGIYLRRLLEEPSPVAFEVLVAGGIRSAFLIHHVNEYSAFKDAPRRDVPDFTVAEVRALLNGAGEDIAEAEAVHAATGGYLGLLMEVLDEGPPFDPASLTQRLSSSPRVRDALRDRLREDDREQRTGRRHARWVLEELLQGREVSPLEGLDHQTEYPEVRLYFDGLVRTEKSSGRTVFRCEAVARAVRGLLKG